MNQDNIDIIQKTLPAWVIVGGFLCSLGVTIYELFKLFLNATPSLEVRLTKEVFFRVSEHGETLFPNVVMVSRRAPVEIRNVSLNLVKKTGSTKSYHIDVIYFGDKVREDGNVLANNHFYTQSPIDFVLPNSPKRTVYMGGLSEYRDKIRNAFDSFRMYVNSERQSLDKAVEQGLEGLELESRKISMYSAVAAQAYAQAGLFLEGIQLEKGTFQLTVSVEYRAVGFLRHVISKVSTSSIEFEVQPDVRETYKTAANKMFLTLGGQLLDLNQQAVVYPENYPRNLKELN